MIYRIDDLKKHLQPRRDYIWFAMGLLLVCTVASITSTLDKSYIAFIWMVGFVLQGIPFIIEYIRYTARLNQYKCSGLLHDAAVDFNQSVSYMNGNVKLGTKYIFIKHSCRILAYSEIVCLYLVKYKYRSFILRADLCNGKTISICNIIKQEYSLYKKRSIMLMRHIFDRNANIHIDQTIIEFDPYMEEKINKNRTMSLSLLSGKAKLSDMEGTKNKKEKKKEKINKKQKKE